MKKCLTFAAANQQDPLSSIANVSYLLEIREILEV